jgi:hypothetical protein
MSYRAKSVENDPVATPCCFVPDHRSAFQATQAHPVESIRPEWAMQARRAYLEPSC